MAKSKTQQRKMPTARPTHAAGHESTQGVDPGLSIAPEDVGLQFLRTATEQGNFETSDGGGLQELSITDGAPTDDALPGPANEPGRSLWESTVDVALQSEDEALPNEGGMADADDEDEDENEEIVDVTSDVVREASLFDHEANQLGEVEAPRVATDDTGVRKTAPHSAAPPHPRRSAR